MIFRNSKTYDVLKFIALTVLPAVNALWLTLGDIWGFPYVTEIGATIAAVDVFLGALLGISNANYKQAGMTQMFNEDLLKDMLGYDEDLHELGEAESEASDESEV